MNWEKLVKDIIPDIVKYLVFLSIHAVWLYMVVTGGVIPDALNYMELGLVAYFGVELGAATYRTVKNGTEAIKPAAARVKEG